MYMICLPNGVVSAGYARCNQRFYTKQLFYSEEHDFTGTEEDFLKAGLAYAYVQLDKYSRLDVTADVLRTLK